MLKKFCKFLLGLILVLALGVCGLFFGKGYLNYSSLTAEKSVDTCVQEVMSKSTYVSHDEIADDLFRATVAIEDRRFYDHGGVDYIGLARAVVSQFDDNLLTSGGSTITQQLAKNLYGQFNSGIGWKSTEYYIAKYLEKHYSKSDILTLYVNVINYGNNYTGIYEASIGYFGVTPENLTTAQCTILAGIPQSPSNYELFDHFDNAKQKQKSVLKAMYECGYITEDQIDSIYNESVY